MAAEPSCAHDAVVDVEDLLARCLGNIEFADHILSVFQERCAHDMDELAELVESRDLESAALVAHRMQGACANAAVRGMKTRASRLRAAAVERSADDVRARYEELRKEWEQFLASPPPLATATGTGPSTRAQSS